MANVVPNSHISFSPAIKPAILFVVLRKEGKTLDREMLCSDCCLSRDVFDSTVAKVEEEFPDYR